MSSGAQLIEQRGALSPAKAEPIRSRVPCSAQTKCANNSGQFITPWYAARQPLMIVQCEDWYSP